MSNAWTLHDMSPGLRKVVGRESPRATLAEEPDAGNPLVRIWRGAELGNRSAYSTSPFARAPTRWRLPAPRSLQLPPPATGERRRPPARPQPRTPRVTPGGTRRPATTQTGADG